MISQRSAQPAATARGELTLVHGELAVVRGEPTAAELAAITVVVSALARRGSRRPVPGPPSGSWWAARHQFMRPQLHPGPGAWRASVLPR